MRSPKPNLKLILVHEGAEKQVDMRLVTASCKRYFNAIHQLSRISKSERLFYDYLCEFMDSRTNVVNIDIELKKQFAGQLASWTGKRVDLSYKSMPIFTKHLIQAQLIVPYRQYRATYQVNPKYAYKGTETMRKQLIAEEIKWCLSKKQPFSHLIDTTEELFIGKMNEKKRS